MPDRDLTTSEAVIAEIIALRHDHEALREHGSQNLRRFKVLISIGFSILVLGVMLALYIEWGQSKAGAGARSVLCIQYTNNRDSVRESQAYLDAVHQYEKDVAEGRNPPRGRVPIKGITEADIQSGLNRSRSYLKAVENSGLGCDVEPSGETRTVTVTLPAK